MPLNKSVVLLCSCNSLPGLSYPSLPPISITSSLDSQLLVSLPSYSSPLQLKSTSTPTSRRLCSPCGRPQSYTTVNNRRGYATVYSRRPDGPAHHDVPDWPKALHPTPYDILAMRKNDPYTKHRFFQLVKIYHPDRHGHTPTVHRLPHATRLERYRLIVAANDLLSDPSRRSLYDTQGVGWTGDRPPTLNESVRHAEKSWRHQPGNASRNATWEDWERWYDARDGKTHDSMYMSNGVFATLVVMMCMIGAFAQMSRAEQSGAEYLEMRDQSNLAIGQQMARTTSVSAGRSKDERVVSFLRERENIAYEFTPSKYDEYAAESGSRPERRSRP
ncbi:J domain-containing protein 1 [Neonectria magnoliae]|uniref:J domain-containing protein 1 n=1 Tax=Neonectria magnoliae TaxID=2732573 RepID=A0ABR1HQC5_9HYPO